MNVFLPAAVLVGERTWNSPFPESVVRVVRRVRVYKRCIEGWDSRGSWLSRTLSKERREERENGEESELVVGKSVYASVKTILQRFVDDDRLTDACWQSEMREVELWENERYVGESPLRNYTTSSN